VWAVTGSAKFLTKLKTGSSRLKTARTAENVEASQTTKSMRNSMNASTVSAVFGLPLPVLFFVADSRTLVRLCVNFTEPQLPVFFSKCGNNCSGITINNVQLQNSNLEFGIPPISYT